MMHDAFFIEQNNLNNFIELEKSKGIYEKSYNIPGKR